MVVLAVGAVLLAVGDGLMNDSRYDPLRGRVVEAVSFAVAGVTRVEEGVCTGAFGG